MDVDRYEKDLATLTDSNAISALNLSGIDRSFGNATLFTWTAGLERKFGNLTADASYVGTAAQHLPRYGFPNAYPGASPGFAPHTDFDASGNVTGGFGVENVIFADAHSTYHALQTSLSGTVGHGGPGVQASYTWSKSHRRRQPGAGRHRIDGRGHFGLLAESLRHASGEGPVDLRRDPRLWPEPGAGPAS